MAESQRPHAVQARLDEISADIEEHKTAAENADTQEEYDVVQAGLVALKVERKKLQKKY